jgi:cytochrome c oxidase subunit IV
LGAITILEVAFALLGKGYIINGVHFPHAIIGAVMITMSVVKAYLIIFEFMHMKYEVKGLPRSVLLPACLLIWGVIAFLWDGTHWKDRRSTDSVQVELTVPVSEHSHDADVHEGEMHDEEH